MLAYVEKLTLAPAEMREGDVIGLRAAGFSDRDILDIVEVAAYYAYVNRIADGLGVGLEEWLDLGYLDNENHAAFHINPLIGPTRLRTQVLPIHLKDEAAKKIRKTIKRLEGEKGDWDFLTNALQGTIHLMYEEDHTELLPELLDYMLKLDEIRGEDFFEVFPEWESLKSYVKP